MNKENASSNPESSKVKAWIKRHPFITGFGVLIILIILISSGGDSSQSADKKVAGTASENQEPVEVISVSASKLAEAYIENEVGADIMYKGKILKISGTVKDIGKDIIDTPYIVLESSPSDYFTQVQCMFSKEDESTLGAMKKGASVVLQGKSSGKLGNVLIRNCAIVTQ